MVPRLRVDPECGEVGEMTCKPCNYCRLKDGCKIKAEKLKRIRGIGLSSITFPCPTQREDLKAGQIVKIQMYYREWDRLDELTAVFTHWSGAPSKTKAVIAFLPDQDFPESIEHPDKELRIASVAHNRIEPTTDFISNPCKRCGLPDGFDLGNAKWYCPICAPDLEGDLL
jgi:hypothetical protein